MFCLCLYPNSVSFLLNDKTCLIFEILSPFLKWINWWRAVDDNWARFWQVNFWMTSHNIFLRFKWGVICKNIFCSICPLLFLIFSLFLLIVSKWNFYWNSIMWDDSFSILFEIHALSPRRVSWYANKMSKSLLSTLTLVGVACWMVLLSFIMTCSW